MSVRDLKAKYGNNLKDHEAVNRAIRAELIGGDDLLDAMDLVDRLARRLRERELAGAQLAQEALDTLRDLRVVMGDVIAQRYGFISD